MTSLMATLAPALLMAACDGAMAPQPGESSVAQPQALFVHEETLGDGARVRFYKSGDHGAIVELTASMDRDADLLARGRSAHDESTVEGVFLKLRPGAPLPGALGDLDQAVKHAPPALVFDPPEHAPPEGVARAKVDVDGTAGVVQQFSAITDSQWDWTGDASWFKANYCKTDKVKALFASCVTNWTAVTSDWWGYYHVGSGMAASFEGTASYSASLWTCSNGACSFVPYAGLSTTIQPRYITTWQFLGSEANALRRFKIVGNGPHPRTHLGVTYSVPTITSFTFSPNQAGSTLIAKVAAFAPNSIVRLYHDSPTFGAQQLGTVRAAANGTATFDRTGFMYITCGELKMKWADSFGPRIIRAQDETGRKATYNAGNLAPCNWIY